MCRGAVEGVVDITPMAFGRWSIYWMRMPHLGPLVESLPVDLLLKTLLLCLDQVEYHRSQADDNGFASALD